MRNLASSARRGAAVTTAIGVALLVLVGIGLREKSMNSQIEKDALEATQQVAQDPQYAGTQAQQQALEDLPEHEREFRLKEAERCMELVAEGVVAITGGVGGSFGAIGGMSSDAIQFTNMTNEEMTAYFKRQHDRDPNNVELMRLNALEEAMRQRLSESPATRNLAQNSYLIQRMVSIHEDTAWFLRNEESREALREEHPEMREMEDSELFLKWLEPKLSNEASEAARAYSRVERALKDAQSETVTKGDHAALTPTPEAINAIVSRGLFAQRLGEGDLDAEIEKAVAQWVSERKSAALAERTGPDGRYSGTLSGGASGPCTVSIRGTSVQITLSGKGRNRYGSFKSEVGGSGQLSSWTGQFDGALSGKVTNFYGTHAVSGSFSGTVHDDNRVTGKWEASSRRVPASGSFKAAKQ